MNNDRFSKEIGEEYDLFSLSTPHHDTFQHKVVSELFAGCADGEGVTICELGFGTGITSLELLDTNSTCHLIAVDNEPKMEALANARLSGCKGGYQLQISDMLHFLQSQKNDSFDGTISVWVLHNVEREYRKKVLDEIFRTLKPGGIFVNGDKVAVDDFTEHQMHLTWQLKQFEIYDNIGKPELKEEWTKHYLEDELETVIMRENEVASDLKESGFRDITIGNRSYMDAILSAKK